jgi:hypothetical protein
MSRDRDDDDDELPLPDITSDLNPSTSAEAYALPELVEVPEVPKTITSSSSLFNIPASSSATVVNDAKRVQRHLVFTIDDDEDQGGKDRPATTTTTRPGKRSRPDDSHSHSSSLPSKRAKIHRNDYSSDDGDDPESYEVVESASDDLIAMDICMGGQIMAPLKLDIVVLHEFSERKKIRYRKEIQKGNFPFTAYQATFCTWPRYMVCVRVPVWDSAVKMLGGSNVSASTRYNMYCRLLLNVMVSNLRNMDTDHCFLAIDGHLLVPYIVKPGLEAKSPAVEEIHAWEKELMMLAENPLLSATDSMPARPKTMRHRGIRLDVLPLLAVACSAVPGVSVGFHPLLLCAKLLEICRARTQEANQRGLNELASTWSTHGICLELTQRVVVYFCTGPPSRDFADPRIAWQEEMEKRMNECENRQCVSESHIVRLREMMEGKPALAAHSSSSSSAVARKSRKATPTMNQYAKPAKNYHLRAVAALDQGPPTRPSWPRYNMIAPDDARLLPTALDDGHTSS